MENSKSLSVFLKIRNVIRRRLIAGLIVIVPLWLTYIALKFFFFLLDGFFAPIIGRIFGFAIPGLGFLLLILFIYFIGMITTNIIGKSLIHLGEGILNRIPIVKNIYQGAKQLMNTISMSKTLGFKRVVLIEYPRNGLLAVGFVTNHVDDKRTGKKFIIVFIPTPPNPVNGIFEIVPERQVIETNLTIEEGIKMVMSAGILTPAGFQTLEFAKPQEI